MFVMLAGVAFVYHRKHEAERAQRNCVAYMARMWSASVGYAMENKVGLDTKISPQLLAPYLHNYSSMKCPLGQEEYADFVIWDGPRCPNSAPHTQARQPDPKIEIMKQAKSKALGEHANERGK